MSQEEEEGHFLDLAFRAQIELRNVKVKVTLFVPIFMIGTNKLTQNLNLI